MRSLWHSFLQLFFRLLYNELAWSYDVVAWLISLGRWTAWGRSALPHLQGERVLELGHGPGHLLVALEERGLEPVGIDLSASMARLARRRLGRSIVDVPLVRAYAQALPFRAGGFDSVVATFPTDFIVHPRALDEARRVLAARGRLVLVLSAQFEGENLAVGFLRWLYRITGQLQPPIEGQKAWSERAGFSPRIVWEEVDNTSVMLVLADKV